MGQGVIIEHPTRAGYQVTLTWAGPGDSDEAVGTAVLQDAIDPLLAGGWLPVGPTNPPVGPDD